MGFYRASQLLPDAAAPGIEARAADMRASAWDYRLELGRVSGGSGGWLSFPQPSRAQPAIRAALLQGKLLEIRGVLRRKSEIVRMIANSVRDLSDALAQPSARADALNSFRSRNFH